MNIFKESLFSSMDSSIKSNTSRHSRSKPTNRIRQENNSLSEPLLSLNDNDNIELGSIDSDDDNDKTKLHVVRSRHTKKESIPVAHGAGSIVIVEKPIEQHETLQAFAIRYRVPISQLKRLNNLQNDQDFYALKFCRVPVSRFGLLHESPSSSTIVDLNEQSSINSSLPSTHIAQQDHRAFLNAMDRDLASMRTKVEQLVETPLIPDQPSVKMLSRSSKKTKNDLNCDGADCGCKFWHIVLIIVLIALLVPLVYIYIYLESPIILSEHIPI